MASPIDLDRNNLVSDLIDACASAGSGAEAREAFDIVLQGSNLDLKDKAGDETLLLMMRELAVRMHHGDTDSHRVSMMNMSDSSYGSMSRTRKSYLGTVPFPSQAELDYANTFEMDNYGGGINSASDVPSDYSEDEASFPSKEEMEKSMREQILSGLGRRPKTQTRMGNRIGGMTSGILGDGSSFTVNSVSISEMGIDGSSSSSGVKGKGSGLVGSKGRRTLKGTSGGTQTSKSKGKDGTRNNTNRIDKKKKKTGRNVKKVVSKDEFDAVTTTTKGMRIGTGTSSVKVGTESSPSKSNSLVESKATKVKTGAQGGLSPSVSKDSNSNSKPPKTRRTVKSITAIVPQLPDTENLRPRLHKDRDDSKSPKGNDEYDDEYDYNRSQYINNNSYQINPDNSDTNDIYSESDSNENTNTNESNTDSNSNSNSYYFDTDSPQLPDLLNDSAYLQGLNDDSPVANAPNLQDYMDELIVLNDNDILGNTVGIGMGIGNNEEDEHRDLLPQYDLSDIVTAAVRGALNMLASGQTESEAVFTEECLSLIAEFVTNSVNLIRKAHARRHDIKRVISMFLGVPIDETNTMLMEHIVTSFFNDYNNDADADVDDVDGHGARSDTSAYRKAMQNMVNGLERYDVSVNISSSSSSAEENDDIESDSGKALVEAWGDNEGQPRYVDHIRELSDDQFHPDDEDSQDDNSNSNSNSDIHNVDFTDMWNTAKNDNIKSIQQYGSDANEEESSSDDDDSGYSHEFLETALEKYGLNKYEIKPSSSSSWKGKSSNSKVDETGSDSGSDSGTGKGKGTERKINDVRDKISNDEVRDFAITSDDESESSGYIRVKDLPPDFFAQYDKAMSPTEVDRFLANMDKGEAGSPFTATNTEVATGGDVIHHSKDHATQMNSELLNRNIDLDIQPDAHPVVGYIESLRNYGTRKNELERSTMASLLSVIDRYSKEKDINVVLSDPTVINSFLNNKMMHATRRPGGPDLNIVKAKARSSTSTRPRRTKKKNEEDKERKKRRKRTTKKSKAQSANYQPFRRSVALHRQSYGLVSNLAMRPSPSTSLIEMLEQQRRTLRTMTSFSVARTRTQRVMHQEQMSSLLKEAAWAQRERQHKSKKGLRNSIITKKVVKTSLPEAALIYGNPCSGLSPSTLSKKQRARAKAKGKPIIR
jgi:hypothetical protein